MRHDKHPPLITSTTHTMLKNSFNTLNSPKSLKKKQLSLQPERMAEENQVSPLAPPGIYGRSDEEFGKFKPFAARRVKKSNKCFVYILAGIVILSIITLVFATTVMRVDAPEAKLKSVAVKNLRYTTTPSASLNATLIAELTIKNTNFGRFRYKNSTASVIYGDVKVGDLKISEGRVKARETKRMNVTVHVRSNGPSGFTDLSGDINRGMMNLRSYAKLSGRVYVIKMKKHRTAEMNCTMSLNLSSTEIQDLLCYL